MMEKKNPRATRYLGVFPRRVRVGGWNPEDEPWDGLPPATDDADEPTESLELLDDALVPEASRRCACRSEDPTIP